MVPIFALQLTLPLLLIGWLAFAPPRSATVFYVQVLATALALFAVSLTGLWLFPPWWAPWAFGALLLLAALRGMRRRLPFAAWFPSGWGGWVVMAAFMAISGWGVVQSASALTGRVPQAGAVVELAFPLKHGTYLVVNGGSHLSVNPHLMTLDARMARFKPYRGQSYGVDIVKLDGWGLRANGLQPPEPGAYDIYDVPVYAPCRGVVLIALDGLPDMPVPQMDREHMAGNHVLLRCKDADVLLGHLKPGSLRAAVGQQLAVGQHLANVGNSGNTGEPHLHIHAQQAGPANAPLSGNPLPVSFEGRFVVRGDRVTAP